MSDPLLLLGPGELRGRFRDLCDQADEIYLASPHVEGGCWAWETLQRNREKLLEVLVPEGSTKASTHSLLQETSALRWVGATAASFGAPLFVFQRGSSVSVLIGGPLLTNATEGADVAALFEGTRDDAFSCVAHDALDELRRNARVPIGLGVTGGPGAVVEAPPTLLSDASIEHLVLLVDGQEMLSARERFVSDFQSGAEVFDRPFPGRDGPPTAQLHWHSRYRIWASFRLGASRYLKAFGTEAPVDGAAVLPDTEISVPVEGIDRRCVGAFARDPATDRIYLVHRARLGQGVAGSRNFWRSTRLRGVSLDEGDGGDETRVALVAEIGSPRLVEQVAAFLRELARVRDEETEAAPEERVTPGAQFLEFERDRRIAILHTLLLGTGAIEKDRAVRECARALRDAGLADYVRLRAGGELYDTILATLESAVSLGAFDRPRRGYVRAICPDVEDVPFDLWALALEEALGEEMLAREEAIQGCLHQARELFGLEAQVVRAGGRVDSAIRRAIRRGLRRRELLADGDRIGSYRDGVPEPRG